MSLPEVLLWREIKGAKLGVSFRKQHPIGVYKADFCCTEHRLVVEVDGMAHGMGDTAKHDAKRDAFLQSKGYSIMRIPALDVLNRLEFVLEAIKAALPPLHRSAVPLPASGEDLA